jgi:hypothetical protein
VQRHPHRRAGGDAVIDDNRRAPSDFQCRTAFAVRFPAPLDLLELTCDLLLDVAIRNIQTRCQTPVDKNLRAGAVGDRAKSELGLPGHPDLSHEHDIKRRIERPGYLETDCDTATRQCQDDRLRALQMRQLVGEPAAGLAAICVFHDPRER